MKNSIFYVDFKPKDFIQNIGVSNAVAKQTATCNKGNPVGSQYLPYGLRAEVSV
jgi:hypothetical protein